MDMDFNLTTSTYYTIVFMIVAVTLYVNTFQI
jgi:hypothetical protein